MSTVLGIIAGVILGVIVLVLMPNPIGIVIAAVVAVLGFVGVSKLTTREHKLGGVAASMLPNGEAIAANIDQGRKLAKQIANCANRTHDAEVSKAMNGLSVEIGKLVKYAEDNPGASKGLAHFLNTYSDQCSTITTNWSSIEASGDDGAIAEAQDDVLLAVKYLTQTAQNELGQATDARVAQIEASHEAIKRLMALDGYGVDVDGAGEGQMAADRGGADSAASGDDAAASAAADADGIDGSPDAAASGSAKRKPTRRSRKASGQTDKDEVAR